MRDWEELERLTRQDLPQDLGFGERHLKLSVYERLKYDGRTREGRLARKMARMRIATASDDDLADLARYEFRVCAGHCTYQEILERWIERREEF
ncbi:MAG: hypothetical protein HQ578_02405 [Chloroflexi bacterium]|nr:hypothetical protein [Chloroflexota bacterium]